MKLALVYTSTTPELIDLVESEVKKQCGENVELLSYQDPHILYEARKNGYVTAQAANRLVQLFCNAIKDGAEAILNNCSSVGEVADSVQDYARYVGVPIVRIDEDMCKNAVRIGSNIGVMATLSTTLEPTKKTLLRVARELGKQITLVDGLIDGAFGLNQDEFKALMLKKGEELYKNVDVLLFCQGSMAYCEELLHNTYKIPVLSSPRYGAIALRKALEDKGLLKERSI
ncbi:MAG: aspartate/glutamate racemase family protein [Clostridiales bacterium]